VPHATIARAFASQGKGASTYRAAFGLRRELAHRKVVHEESLTIEKDAIGERHRRAAGTFHR